MQTNIYFFNLNKKSKEMSSKYNNENELQKRLVYRKTATSYRTQNTNPKREKIYFQKKTLLP